VSWRSSPGRAAPQTRCTSIAGQGNPQLNVDLTGTPAKDGIDVIVYKVSIAVSPQAAQVYYLDLRSSSTKPVVKAWGVATGA
jgi:hypothetical protein